MKFPRTLILACLVTLILSNPVLAQTPDELIAIRTDYAKAMDDHDIETLLSFYTEDIVYDVVTTPPPGVGLDEMRAGWIEQFTPFPDFHGDEGIVLAADNIVVVDHNAVGTYANGNTMYWPHLDIIEFEGDKIKKVTTYGDELIQMIQLGFMPAPEMPPLVPSIEVPEPEAPGLSPLEATAHVIDLWNSHDAASVAKMYDSSARILIGPLATWLDRTQVMALNEMYFSGFSNAKTKVVRTVDMGDGWVLCEHVTFGIQDGAHMGIPASGHPCEVRVVWLIRYGSNGLILEQTAHYNNMAVITQLTTPPFPLDGIWITSAPTPYGNWISTTTYVAQNAARTQYSGTLEFINGFPLFADLYPDSDPSLVFSAGGHAVMVGRNKYEATYLTYDRKYDPSTGIMEIVGIDTLNAHFEVVGPDQIVGQGMASYYMAAQDADQDGFPDADQEPVACFPWEWTCKRLTVMPGCTPAPGQ